MQDLKQNSLFFSAVCLQESWLSQDDDISLWQLEGYTCISEGRKCSSKGGLVIYYMTNIIGGLHIQLLHFMNDPSYGKVNLYKFLGMNCHIN